MVAIESIKKYLSRFRDGVTRRRVENGVVIGGAGI
jgi:hypothetical protein